MSFLASPSDVAKERDLARKVIARLVHQIGSKLGAYDKFWQAEIAWVLSIRNETNHDTDTAFSDTRIERAIAAAHDMRDTLIAR